MRVNDLVTVIRDCGALFDVANAPKLQEMLASAGVGTWHIDLQTGLARWDEVAARMMGMAPYGEEASAIAPIHPDDRSLVLESLERSFATGSPHEVEFRPLETDGIKRWVRQAGRPSPSRGGWSRWMSGILLDVTDRKLIEQTLVGSERRLEALTRSLPGMAYRALGGALWDMQSASAAAEEMTGFAPKEICASASGWTRMIHPDDLPRIREQAQAALGACQPFLLRYRIVTRDGETKWVHERAEPTYDRSGRVECVDGFIWDVTDNEALGERLQFTTNHDGLTRLPNRGMFHQLVQEALERATLSKSRVGILLVDIDDFKLVNQSLGHVAGDNLLCAVAERLTAAVGPNGIVGRLSGDEFAVLVADLPDLRAIQRTAARVMAAFDEPFAHQGKLFSCRASLGVSVSPGNGRKRAALMKNADIALDAAKANGGGRIQFYDSRMRAALQARSSMLSVARDMVRNDWIVPHYQPKISLVTGRVLGFEALLRWNHPRHGLQGPGAVAAAFQDRELSASIGDRMISLILADMWRWSREGVDFGHISINASPAEFRQGDFAETLLDRMEKAGIPANRIQVEVTESAFVSRGADYIENALAMLGAAGVAVALDDFGTGRASLLQLRHIPIQSIKIDRSFVHGLFRDTNDETVVRALLSFCHDIGIRTVAEGVETNAQAEYLRHFGCEEAQGYLFSAAAGASEVPDLIAAFDEAAVKEIALN